MNWKLCPWSWCCVGPEDDEASAVPEAPPPHPLRPNSPELLEAAVASIACPAGVPLGPVFQRMVPCRSPRRCALGEARRRPWTSLAGAAACSDGPCAGDSSSSAGSSTSSPSTKAWSRSLASSSAELTRRLAIRQMMPGVSVTCLASQRICRSVRQSTFCTPTLAASALELERSVMTVMEKAGMKLRRASTRSMASELSPCSSSGP
mmetsp:Transcript_25952/g.70188  ORF Transcript_25952/g.70188 Transcript_25952/m.70188 type:complete len:206 (-) Transcript_25952:1810-2427(-)